MRDFPVDMYSMFSPDARHHEFEFIASLCDSCSQSWKVSKLKSHGQGGLPLLGFDESEPNTGNDVQLVNSASANSA